MEPLEQLDVILPALRRTVAGTRKDQLTNATPCAKWTVRDVINHVVGGGHMFAAGLRGEAMGDPDGPMPDLVGDDHVAAFDAAIADFEASVKTPGALERQVALPFATLPADAALRLAASDLLIHTWDLSRATGQNAEVPEHVIAEADGFVHMFLQPPMRDGDTFAEEKQAPAGASALDRLAAFAGRDV